MKYNSKKYIVIVLCMVVLAFCLPALAQAAEITRTASTAGELHDAFMEVNTLAAEALAQGKNMDWVNIFITDDIELNRGYEFSENARIRLRSTEGNQFTLSYVADEVGPLLMPILNAQLEVSNLVFDGKQNGSTFLFSAGGHAKLGPKLIIENAAYSSPFISLITSWSYGVNTDNKYLATLTMTDVIVRNNTDTFISGAAIDAQNSLIIDNCVFENNSSARSFGGAISANGTIQISNSTFAGNLADGGGALFASKANVTINDCIFKNNRACNPLMEQGGNGGGAIQLQYNTQATISNCDFISNTTDCSGGALLTYVGTTVTLNNCNFLKNEADDHGAAITVAGAFSQDEAQGSTVYLNNCLLEGNVAKGTEIQSDQNNAPDSPGGGAIYLHEFCKAYLNKGTVVRNNSSEYCGGAAFVAFGGELICDGAEIYGNKAVLDGGAVYVDGAGAYLGFDHGNNMIPNPDNSFATGGKFTLKDGIIRDNTAGRNGGGVYINGENEVVVEGEQYIYTGGELEMTGGIIVENTAKDMGGGVYVGACDTGDKGGVLQMVDGAICRNIAGENGNTSTGENDAGADVYSEGGNAYITLIGADTVTAYILDSGNTHVPAAYRRMSFTNWFDDYSDQDPTYGKSAEKIGTGTQTGRYETSIDPDRIVYQPTEKDNNYNALILDSELLPEPPLTGDAFPISLMAALLLVSSAAGVLLKKKIHV